MNTLLPILVAGISVGSIYAVAAMGLTLTYKTTGIFNFAQGAIAAAAAYVFYVLHIERGLSWPIAAVLTLLAFGFVGGIVLEFISRPLADVPIAQRIVASVGLLVAINSLLLVIFGSDRRVLPEYLGRAVHNVGGAYFATSDLVKALIALGSALALGAFFRSTRTGRAMRAVVDDPTLLDLTGIDPARIRRVSWMIGCGFAALSGILIAPLLNVDVNLLTLLVVHAFGACAIGRFTSIPMTYAGGLIVGVGEQVVQHYTTSHPTLVDLYPATSFLILLIVMVCIPRRKLVEVGRLIRERPPRPSTLPMPLRIGGAVVGISLLLLGPFYIDSVRLSTATAALAMVILYLSLVLLIRVSGQVSLGHIALQGAGTALFAHAVSSGGLSSFNLGLPWPLAVLAAGLLTIPIGLVIALPAVRLSGTFLALATLGFGLLLQQTGYRYGFLFGASGSVPTPRPGWADGPWAYYYVAAICVIISAIVVKLVERARLGRLLRALADAPTALSTLGASITVSRNLAFALSAFLAGISGAILGGVSQQSNSTSFQALASLGLIAILAVSGAISGGGTIIPAFVAGAVFTFLPSYATGGSEKANAAFQLAFGVTAIIAALMSNGRGGDIFARLAAGSADRGKTSPVHARTVEAEARERHVAYAGAIPSWSQTANTSSKIEPGTMNGSVADRSTKLAATSSADGTEPASAAQPSAKPTKTRAKRRAHAE
jgi:branched-subunit amino acid ABC-type transport system permease component